MAIYGRWGGTQTRLFPAPPKGAWPCSYLDRRLLVCSPRAAYFCCLSLPVVGTQLRQPRETQTQGLEEDKVGSSALTGHVSRRFRLFPWLEPYAMKLSLTSLNATVTGHHGGHGHSTQRGPW